VRALDPLVPHLLVSDVVPLRPLVEVGIARCRARRHGRVILLLELVDEQLARIVTAGKLHEIPAAMRRPVIAQRVRDGRRANVPVA